MGTWVNFSIIFLVVLALITVIERLVRSFRAHRCGRAAPPADASYGLGRSMPSASTDTDHLCSSAATMPSS